MKRERINELYNSYSQIFSGYEIVLGDGNIDAGLLMVGEAPGREEVRLGKPFVGAAGKNLSEFLDIIGLSRDSIYITNAIKFKLSANNPKTGRVVNRPAAKDEIIENRQYIIEEIDIIRPEFVVTLGNVPLKSVTGDMGASIGNVHGTVTDINIKDRTYKLYPLYHPASIIYNRSLRDTYLADIEKLSKLMKLKQ